MFSEDLSDTVKNALEENKYKYFRFSGGSGYANIAEIEVYTDELQGDPTPKPYEVKSYTAEVNSDGTAVLKTADVYVQNPEGVRLYSAVYDSAGVLAGVKLSDVTAAGESTIDINITAPAGGSAKIFLWHNMKPLTEVKSVS